MNNYEQQFENETNNSGVSFSEIFSLIKKNLILILIVTFITTVIGFVYGKFIQKPTYSAKVSAMVQVNSDEMSEYNSFVYARYIAESIGEFIVSQSVTKEVARELIDEKYEFTHALNTEGVLEHYSKKLNKKFTNDEYEKELISKANEISKGTKISSATDSLIIDITYSSPQVDDNTSEEVAKTAKLILQKAQEVAKTLKNEESTYKFPKEESVKAVKYAYCTIKKLEEIKDANDIVIGYKSTINPEKTYTVEELNEIVDPYAQILRQNFFISYDGKNLVMSIKNTAESTTLDPEMAFLCLSYLNEYAIKNPVDDVFVKEYMYPAFANKLVQMDNANVYAKRTTNTTLMTLVAFIIGLVASCGVILVRFLMDDTFKSKEELEHLTGVNVLAYIDKFETKDGE